MEHINAVIMAAGTSSRFAPLSYERHKALTVVRDEVLIERQIRQLNERGIDEIHIITGYKAEQFEYLVEKYGVTVIHNPDYLVRNNNGSIWVARDVIRNTYICSADNYFCTNPFEANPGQAYYAAVYSRGATSEWCMTEKNGVIDSVRVGGQNSWYMLGQAYWDIAFSSRFLDILEVEYDRPETVGKLWEDIYIDHITELPLRMRKYPEGVIYEFDTLDELREFDQSYISDTRSTLLKKISKKLCITEDEIKKIECYKSQDASAAGFTFRVGSQIYKYGYASQKLEEI